MTADKSPPLPDSVWVSEVPVGTDLYTADQMRERDAMWHARLAALTDGAEPVGEFVGYGRVTGEPHVRMKEGLAAGSLLYTAPRPSAALVGLVEKVHEMAARIDGISRIHSRELSQIAMQLSAALPAVSATPAPAPAESLEAVERVRLSIENKLADAKYLNGAQWAELTNFINAEFATLRAVSGGRGTDAEIANAGNGGEMSLRVALDFADNPRPFPSLAAPADTNGELYKALRVLAAAYRSAPSTPSGEDYEGEWPENCPPFPSYLIGPKDAFVNGWTLAMVWRDGVAKRATTPAAPALPDGWVMVPRKIFIEASAWEAASFSFGGPATGEGEEYMDCTLWVGEIEGDDGQMTYGLHVSCDECPEEGSITLSEFAAAPQREGG